MHIARQLFYSFFLMLLSLSNSRTLYGVLYTPEQTLTIEECLLPDDHPLQKKLETLFESDQMFNNRASLSSWGFEVYKRVHRGLMVASHPSLQDYLLKKFEDKIPQKEQLKNYLSRINGARALRNFIKLNHLHHIVVPQKWLYPLPAQFSDRHTGEKSYILIVQKMDICKGGKDPRGEVANKYRNIDKEILRELCIVLYNFRGLDSVLDNLPFTYQDKIAFIDTEHWEEHRRQFLRRIKPFLSRENYDYALIVRQELQDKDH